MTELLSYLRRELGAAERTAVLGVGSELCRDDGVGEYFISLLESALGGRGDILLIKGGAAPENFTGVIKAFAPDTLFVVDAAFMELAPGSIEVLPAEKAAGLSFSTHMLPLPLMLRYIENETGAKTVVIGIQPKTTEQGFGISEEARRGAEILASLFTEALTGEKQSKRT